jgi:hypothetical protein
VLLRALGPTLTQFGVSGDVRADIVALDQIARRRGLELKSDAV